MYAHFFFGLPFPSVYIQFLSQKSNSAGFLPCWNLDCQLVSQLPTLIKVIGVCETLKLSTSLYYLQNQRNKCRYTTFPKLSNYYLSIFKVSCYVRNNKSIQLIYLLSFEKILFFKVNLMIIVLL